MIRRAHRLGALATVPALVAALAVAGGGTEGPVAGTSTTAASAVQASLELPLLPALLPQLFPAPAPPGPTGPPPLFDPALPLTAGPVPVPLEYRMPSLNVTMPVVGVGSAPGAIIDAPQGPVDDPVWNSAFWFRGSAAPGTPGVTDIIGHVDDTNGRYLPFAKVRKLKAGNVVEMVDKRTGEVIHYRITGTSLVRADRLHGTEELSRLFGAGAVTGAPADKAADAASGVARLTLMTCTGAWRNGGFDQRFFAFGVRDETASHSP
jgi:hypothetical protein